MKSTFAVLVIVFLGMMSVSPVLANSVVIDFEALTSINNAFVPSPYSEDGFTLNAISSALTVVGTSEINFTGSTSLFNGFPNEITELKQTNGDPFTLTSIDLAELNGDQVASVDFIGNLFGGGTVQQTFTLDGAAFGVETFSFSSGFTNLTSVTWTQTSPFHQFDNIVVDGMVSAFPGTITKTLQNGPRVAIGGTLVDLTGLVTGSNDAGPIDIGRTDSQFYEFMIAVTNDGSDGELDGKIVSDMIPDEYDLDPRCGEDPGLPTACDNAAVGDVDRDDDDFADGIINENPAKCTVITSTSGGGGKKGGAGLEPEFLTILIGNLNTNETCAVRVFVQTEEDPGKGNTLFVPTSCRELDSGVLDTIPLNHGVKMFDPDSGDRLLGPIGSLQLTPNNCP